MERIEFYGGEWLGFFEQMAQKYLAIFNPNRSYNTVRFNCSARNDVEVFSRTQSQLLLPSISIKIYFQVYIENQLFQSNQKKWSIPWYQIRWQSLNWLCLSHRFYAFHLPIRKDWSHVDLSRSSQPTDINFAHCTAMGFSECLGAQ